MSETVRTKVKDQILVDYSSRLDQCLTVE